MSWMNDDGLYVTFGTEKADPSKGGQLAVADGEWKVVEAEIADMTDLGTTAEIIGTEGGEAARGVEVPKGAFIYKVVLEVETACTSGGSATLDIGLIQAADRTTAVDDDGLIAAGALATMDAAGDIVEYTQGSTGHGALIGTALAANSVLCASYNTAAFTAGKVRIRVYYR